MGTLFKPRYLWLEMVDSTNTYCMRMAQDGESEGLAVAAYYQEQGRGQRGNVWESEKGKNLTFSILLRPTFLRVEEQFAISKVAALSVVDWLSANGIDSRIKWPNDIYVGDKKIAGILIENSFSSATLDVCIVGIGLNLNQSEFTQGAANPTSMFMLTGKQFKPEIVLGEQCRSFQARYLQLKQGLTAKISDDYLKSFYRFGSYHFYRNNDGRFKAKIVGVKPSGELIVETEDGLQKSFAFKEVTFEI